MKMLALVVAAVVLVGGTVAHVALAQGHEHVIQAPEEAKWGPAPPFIPQGAQIAVLSGDPTKAVPYAVRLKFPANYAIPAHSHPTDENVVVTSGAVTFGMGNTLVKGAAANKTVGVGGYFLAPTGMSLNIPGFIVEIARQQGIPTMGNDLFFVERGEALASYGPGSYASVHRQAARLVTGPIAT